MCLHSFLIFLNFQKGKISENLFVLLSLLLNFVAPNEEIIELHQFITMVFLNV